MGKLQKYNQILFSIIGTITIIAAIGLIITISYKQINKKQRRETGLIASEIQQQLKKENKRLQKVNFGQPKLIDEEKKLFLISVNHNTLDNPEPIKHQYPQYDDSPQYFGMFGYYTGNNKNNIILYSKNDNSSKLLFNKRFFINDFAHRKLHGKHILLVSGTDKDSNNDNKLNSQDLQQLYLIDLEGGKQYISTLKSDQTFLKIVFEKIYTPNMKNINDVEEKIIIRVGIDENKDGTFNPKQESYDYYLFDLNKQTLEPIIPDDLKSQLQQILDNG